MDDLALLRLEQATLWASDGDGRLLHCRTGAAEPPPRLVVGGCGLGLAWACAADVPSSVVDSVGQLLAPEPSAERVGWAPAEADAVLQAVAAVGDLAPPHGGPSFVVDGPVPSPTGVDVRTSEEVDEDAHSGLLPATDRPLTTPWAVAVVEGRVAAVCETARSAPTSVEAGVWTYAPYRRRGLAAAVTAAWSALVTDRTAFYSTSWDNLASQGVARRLALRPIGHWWQVSAA